jgi:osmoprotectant transport system permease protein
MSEQLANLPEFLGEHLRLTLTALVIGIGASFPLALLACRIRTLQAPALAVASAIQTIPSLALLALMVPLLRVIGFLPAVIALILYSMLPVLRNTITGIEAVEPNLIEAGRGLGMTPGQLLWRVQVPLAMPVIIAGVRTSTVWVVGIATLSTPVGATSLGNYIFTGLAIQNHAAVLMGCIAAAVLALVLDGLIRLLQIAATRRSGTVAGLAGAGLLVVFAGGLSPLVLSPRPSPGATPVVIGAKDFTEQYILAGVVAEVLRAAGFRAETLDNLGSTVVFDALVQGDVDTYVDYSGTVWRNHMKRADNPGPEATLRGVTSWLEREHGIVCLGPLGFENTYALAMPRAQATRLGVRTIEDLRPHTPRLTLGASLEFFGRPEWPQLRDTYGLSFAANVSMEPALMYGAVDQGDVDVIAAFSSDGRIAAFDLVVLEDPRQALPPYDAILLLGPDAAHRPNLIEALGPLIGAVDAETMQQANKRIDVDGASVSEAARELSRSVLAPALE